MSKTSRREGSPSKGRRASESDASRAGRYWTAAVEQRYTHQRLGWLDHPKLPDPTVYPETAGSYGNWALDLADELGIERDGRWLSLGCGAGGLEAFVLEQGFAQRLDGFDVSTGSIEAARRNAADKSVTGAHFDIADFHALDLRDNAYDVVLMSMSLHHVEQLNRLLRQIHRWLKPGGVLLVNEFIGPCQFQYDDHQLARVREVLELLPERLRIDTLNGHVKEGYGRMPRAHWFEVDPSESICSAQIPAGLRRYFDLCIERACGGPILNLALENIIGNFRDDSPEDQAILRLMSLYEARLIEAGDVDNQFALYAATPRSTPALWFWRLFALGDRWRVARWRIEAGLGPLGRIRRLVGRVARKLGLRR